MTTCLPRFQGRHAVGSTLPAAQGAVPYTSMEGSTGMEGSGDFPSWLITAIKIYVVFTCVVLISVYLMAWCQMGWFYGWSNFQLAMSLIPWSWPLVSTLVLALIVFQLDPIPTQRATVQRPTRTADNEREIGAARRIKEEGLCRKFGLMMFNNPEHFASLMGAIVFATMLLQRRMLINTCISTALLVVVVGSGCVLLLLDHSGYLVMYYLGVALSGKIRKYRRVEGTFVNMRTNSDDFDDSNMAEIEHWYSHCLFDDLLEIIWRQFVDTHRTGAPTTDNP